MRKINCFIFFPTLSQNNSMFNCKDLYKSIDDSSTFKDFLRSYQGMIEIAECEKGINLFYDSENIQDLQKDMVELNQEYMSPQFSFAVLLSNAENVRDKQQLKLHNFYFLWDINTSTAISINSPISILSVIAEQIHQHEKRKNAAFIELMKAAKSATEKSEMKSEFIRLTTAFINLIDTNKYILLHNNCIKIDRSFIPVIIEFSSLKENPAIFSIEHATNEIDFKEWININRPSLNHSLPLIFWLP